MKIGKRITPTIFGVAILIATFFTATIVPLDQASAACVNARVKSWDVLWIRKGPGTKFAKRTSIPAGACGVTITGTCKGAWCRVRYNGVGGWTNTGYLSADSGDGGGGNQCKNWERKCDNGADWACAKYDEQECGADEVSTPEYCVSGPSSKLVSFRERPRKGSEEVGIGRGGDCGMSLLKCSGAWCKMQSHEFDGWLRRKDIQRR